MTAPKVSVIICTCNPRPEYFRRVLEALKAQTLPKQLWELLVIDNASETGIANFWDLGWHANSRHILETQLGLTRARLRGIRESNGSLLVFVDDDNILNSDYLENASRISDQLPFVGAFSGECAPEHEKPIEPWQLKYLGFLAIRKVDRPMWANFSVDEKCLPWGAGLSVVRSVAERYMSLASSDPIRLNMDRKPGILAAGGDSDLALTAYDLGLATGLFPELKLTHLIPAFRLHPEYLLKMKREGGIAGHLLYYARERRMPQLMPRVWSSPGRLLLWLRMSKLDRKMLSTERQARTAARQIILSLAANDTWRNDH